MINNNVLDMIGNTPMIKLNNIGNRGDKRTSSRRTAQRSIHRPT